MIKKELTSVESLEELPNIENLEYPVDMDEIRSTWEMDKDGKSYWKDVPEKNMRK